MSGIIGTVVLFLGCRKITELGNWVAKSTRKLNTWVCNVQREVSGEIQIWEIATESKTGFLGQISTIDLWELNTRNIGIEGTKTKCLGGVILQDYFQEKSSFHTNKHCLYSDVFYAFCFRLRYSSHPLILEIKLQIIQKNIFKLLSTHAIVIRIPESYPIMQNMNCGWRQGASKFILNI